MIKINDNFLNLQEGYLFSIVNKKIKDFEDQHPNKKVIKLGIGDVTLPLCKNVVEEMKKACDEMGDINKFKGYGPEQGYEFLRNKIVEWDYKSRGIELDVNEIFISDGAKCDVSNILDLFDTNNKVAIQDPVYPVYLDSNVIGGRSGNYNKDNDKYNNIIYMPSIEENEFVPDLPNEVADIIYLCSPNNPTGTALKYEELKKWIDYAKENKSIIFYDSAYEAFITQKDIPHSIYEVDGAKEVAIEFRSFSKTAGFTGVRCAYTVIPKELIGYSKNGEKVHINKLWGRRQSTKFNGVSYITQRGAAAVYTEEGYKQIKRNIAFYMENAKTIRERFIEKGYKVYGGINAPYIWLKLPEGKSSWQFFDELLEEEGIAGTPGVGFGPSGEGYFRLSAFGIK